MNPDTRQIKSYVWHNEKCFFVSTIERDSSACISPAPRYNETLVWEYNWATGERGRLIHQATGSKGSIETHLEVCKEIHKGNPLTDD